MDLLPKSEAVARLAGLQRWMRDQSLDAVFIFQDADLYYFAGTVQAGMLCVPPQGEPLYLVQKSISRARMESAWQRLVPFPGFKKAPVWLQDEGLGNLRRIGIETDVLPASYYLRLRESFPQADFIEASEAIRRIRMIKSAHEIEQVRQAAVMLRTTFEQIPSWIRPGVTELELTARIEGHLRSQGHQGITRMRAFNHRIAYGTLSSGASAAYPTSFPGPVGFVGLYAAVPSGGSKRRLAAGEPIMADFVGGYGGYIADKTRIFVLGEPGREMADAHRFVLDLNREIESMLKPGVLCSSIYQHALERVKDSPYAPGFMGTADSQVRFVGHGVGLELDELPLLAGGFDVPLAAGMTIAIEPKIIFAERGGVGIENTYRVTESGFEKLTVFPEEIIAVPI